MVDKTNKMYARSTQGVLAFCFCIRMQSGCCIRSKLQQNEFS